MNFKHTCSNISGRTCTITIKYPSSINLSGVPNSKLKQFPINYGKNGAFTHSATRPLAF